MPQLGTGHAVQQAVPALHDDGTTLILNGDMPLIRAETARALVEACGGAALALLTIDLRRPDRLRPHRARGRAACSAIVEHKDATPAQRAIREVYTGMMAVPTELLKRWLSPAEQQQRAGRVLPDRHRRDGGGRRRARGGRAAEAAEAEVLGVNSPSQLADLERLHQRVAGRAADGRRACAWPTRRASTCAATLACGSDVEIDVNCVFEGDVSNWATACASAPTA